MALLAPQPESLTEPLFHIGQRGISALHLATVPALAVAGLLLTRWISGAVARALEAREVNPNSIHLARRGLKVLGAVLTVVILLAVFSVPLTAFAFASGAIAIGVGFGAQNIINNYISGWILIWERPIRIGDFLEVSGTRGEVEAINTRSTRVRRIDGVHLLIPNSQLLENTVVNWTLIDRSIRTQVRVGVAYGSPIARVRELIEQAALENPDVDDEPPPKVIFDDFGESSLQFDVYVWVETGVDRDLRQVRSMLRFRIAELFDENDITIAFPQRDIHVDGQLTVVGPGTVR